MDTKDKDNTLPPGEQEFALLVRRHKTTVYTVCYMFADGQDEVADLVQDVLLNLWQGFGRFEGRSDTRTWVYRVALNTCITHDRKRRRRVATIPLTMDINPYTDDDANSRQMERLRRRIARLGPFDRAIVMLWLEDMNYDEIGAIVGITPRNVGVRLVRIRERLKQMTD